MQFYREVCEKAHFKRKNATKREKKVWIKSFKIPKNYSYIKTLSFPTSCPFFFPRRIKYTIS